MPCVSSSDFHTTILVDVRWTVTVTIKLRLPPKLLMTSRIPPPAHCRGRWPPWRMEKFSAHSETDSGRKNGIFIYFTCIWRLWRPRLRWSHGNFVDIFCIIKLESLLLPYGVDFEILRLAVLNWYNTGLWRTDRRTDTQCQWQHRASVASRG